MSKTLGILLSAALVSWSCIALAQSWPAKPVRFILPFAPGGFPDILARQFAEKLAKVWGQSVLVDNRGGANGILGAQAAAKAPPDGYTLFFAPSFAMIVNPLIY